MESSERLTALSTFLLNFIDTGRAHRSERFSRCVSSPFFREPCPVSSCFAGVSARPAASRGRQAHRFAVGIHDRAETSCHGLHRIPHLALDVCHRVYVQRLRRLKRQAAYSPDGQHAAPEHGARGCETRREFGLATQAGSPHAHGSGPAGGAGAAARAARRNRRQREARAVVAARRRRPPSSSAQL